MGSLSEKVLEKDLYHLDLCQVIWGRFKDHLDGVLPGSGSNSMIGDLKSSYREGERNQADLSGK